MSKKILYIGNNLQGKTKYPTTMTILSNLLIQENFTVIKTSNKNSKIIRLLDMCFMVIRYRKVLNYILIDTYSTYNFYFAFFTSQFARLYSIKYIPILHGGNLPKRIKKSSKLSNLIFENSYFNVAPSLYLKNSFEKKKYKVILIPNIINIRDYKFKNRNQITPKLFWVRSFKELYNPSLAILVLKLVHEKYKNATLCMVGPFNDKSYHTCLQLAKELNIFDNVEFTGVLTKQEWHKKSIDYDIFINTTNFDNTPISVMEAMALGLPVVSTNAGGMPFLIDHTINGILVDKNDEVQMTNAIISIIEGNFPNLSVNARKKVALFDWEIVKEQWLKILN